MKPPTPTVVVPPAPKPQNNTTPIAFDNTKVVTVVVNTDKTNYTGRNVLIALVIVFVLTTIAATGLLLWRHILKKRSMEQIKDETQAAPKQDIEMGEVAQAEPSEIEYTHNLDEVSAQMPL